MGLMKEFDIRIRGGGDDAIAAVSEYLDMRWIPVGESLPDKGVSVIVRNGLRAWVAYIANDGDDGLEWFCECGACEPGLQQVTHWMPLLEVTE